MSSSLEFDSLQRYFSEKEYEVQARIDRELDPKRKKEFELERAELIRQKEKKMKLHLEKEQKILLEMGSKTLSKGFLLKKAKVCDIVKTFERTKYLSKDIIKKLQKALSETREIAIKDLKSLLLSSGLIKLIMKDLLRSKLTLLEIKLLTRFLKKLMINLFKKPFLSFDISEIKYFWLKLPLSIRRLIMAIMILKQEMIHRFSLDLERMKMKMLKERNIQVKINNIIQLTDEQRRFLFLPDVWIKVERMSDKKNKKIKYDKKN